MYSARLPRVTPIPEPDNGCPGEPTPPHRGQTNATLSLCRFRDLLINRGLPELACDIICKSWSQSTLKSYSSAWNKWESWCSNNQTNYLKPNTRDIVSFLTESFNTGNSTSWTSTLRSVISTLLEVTQGSEASKDPLISRLIRGMSNIEPKKPRYTSTWDVSILLGYLDHMKCESLKDISLKTVTLLALTTAARCSEIASLDTGYMESQPDQLTFHIYKSKTWNKRSMKPVCVHSFHENTNICPVNALRAYVSQTVPIRQVTTSTHLFITTVKPHKPASTTTVGRWVKETLGLAGIDTTLFKAHSTRSASTSKASSEGLPNDTILKVANWSNANTFRRFYQRDLERGGEYQSTASKAFTATVLSLDTNVV